MFLHLKLGRKMIYLKTSRCKCAVLFLTRMSLAHLTVPLVPCYIIQTTPLLPSANPQGHPQNGLSIKKKMVDVHRNYRSTLLWSKWESVAFNGIQKSLIISLVILELSHLPFEEDGGSKRALLKPSLIKGTKEDPVL